MKIPTQIVTRHKVRDAKILQLYASEGASFEKLGKLFGISATRIGQIVYKNRHLLVINKEFEKQRRITHLKRLLKNNEDNVGKKDAIDILNQLRIEVEGNKVEHSGEVNFTQMPMVTVGNRMLEYNLGQPSAS